MEIKVSPRGLVACVRLGPGDWPLANQLRRLLRREGVVYGVDHAAIESICQGAVRPLLRVVAKGKPPTHGRDASVELLFERASLTRRTLARVADPLSSCIVEAGQVIARKVPAESGRPGRDVFGVRLPGRPGADRELLAGPNCVRTRDGLEIRALVSGIPSSGEGGVTVSPVRHIRGHVCAATGDVFFAGDVLVDGDVLPGFRIDATGHVLVRGRIRGATVRAGGQVHARDAIGGGAVITAGAGIVAGSADHARLQAKGTVRIVRDLLFCDVETDADVDVRGRIVGGTIVADEAVHALAIGCRSAVPTRIFLNPGWRSRRREADRRAEIVLARTSLEAVRKLRAEKPAPAAGAPPGPPEPVLAAVETRLTEQLRAAFREVVLARQRAARPPCPRIAVEQAIFKGAELQINAGWLKARSQLPAGEFHEQGGLIVVREAV
ncbi:MAG: DUF342 domain-containing protein [Candidatus Sericytochromatia bacterium]|nr:DUF342 domain-containing protein [Candidatus Tanganyikabacteria bacterium]